MRRTSVAALAALAGVCAVGASEAIAIASSASNARAAARLARPAAAVTGNNPGAGASESRTTQVWMAVDQRAAQRFVDASSTPGSPSYHRFLSPEAYTERFGPSAARVRAVESYLNRVGFTHVLASVNNDYVSGVAPGHSRALRIPASLSGDVLAVTGRGSTEPKGKTASNEMPATQASEGSGGSGCSRYWAQKTQTITPAFDGLSEAAVVVCGYSAKQVRGAYGLTPTDTGKGKTIALIEQGAPDKMFRALTDYAKANGLPTPRAGQYREQGMDREATSSTCNNSGAQEPTLDSEAAYAMAPRADQLMVVGDGCDTSSHGDQALFDAMLAPLTGPGSKPSAAIESVSAGLFAGANERNTPRSLLKIGHAIALRAAAEGVSVLVASGDSPGVETPGSDPDVTVVGGTTLGIGANNQRVFETGWSAAFGERTVTSDPWHDEGILLGGGGGVSDLYREPNYQRSVVPSTMARNRTGNLGRTVPDIAADGDPASGMLFGLIVTERSGKTLPYSTFRQGGTSTATPLIAGIVADAEQGRPSNLGFLNPLLYRLAGSNAFHDILPVSPSDPEVDRAIYTPGETDINHRFHPGFLVDVNDAQNISGTDQVTAPGYDTMTGLGTPNGSSFIDALRAGRCAPCAAGVGAHAAAARATVPLAGSTVPFASRTAATDRLPSARSLTIEVWLRPKESAAERFADAVSTPGNPQFRDFITPDAYTARFGPSPHVTSAVRSWLRSEGFTAVAAEAHRDYVRATAPVDRIDATFHTAIRLYPPLAQAAGGDGSPLYSNDGPLTVPASLAPDVLGVTGLDSAGLTSQLQQRGSHQIANKQAPWLTSCSQYWGQRTVSGLPKKFGTTTFVEAGCGYSASQFRSAYGANMANTGTGQTIAFDEAGGLVPDMFKTLQDFAKQNHLPVPVTARYKELSLQPASCKKPSGSNEEEQMDVEAAYAMAPGATQLVVGANQCHAGNKFQGAFNADEAIIDGNGQEPLASVVVNTWETGYDDQAPSLNQIETAFLVKAAAVGVGMYYSAGDTPCTTQPASNPYATGVGGTTLAISKSGTRLFETGAGSAISYIKHNAWTPPFYVGYGGGQSRVYQQPAYQKGVVPAAMSDPPATGQPAGQAGCRTGGKLPPHSTTPMRSAPDISADAGDGMLVGLIRLGKYINVQDAGTSLSAPLVAGMVVAAQQGQTKPFGFINPALYKLAGTSAFYDPRPVTTKDPLRWRAEVCPKTDQNCGGTTALWLINDQSPAVHRHSGQVTANGYDNTTGVGVPRGQAFITALRKVG